MSFLKSSAAVLAAVMAFGAEGIPKRGTPQPAGLVAHEWGTFTSVANADGNPVPWLAYTGPSSLPCFVHPGGLNAKVNRIATIRMETPVIYFYAPTKMTLSVRVGLPGGSITEWYPEASGYGFDSIEWNSVEALPGETLEFPTGLTGNHYYAARATDSAPLRVGKEQEKLIFYRGLANFPVPLRAAFTPAGRIWLRNAGEGTIAKAIVFESRGGKAGYRVIDGLNNRAEVARPELTTDIEECLRRQLAGSLIEAGLYPKEAQAMLETWRDSWFEEGTRVFYIFPRAAVDHALPLTVNPAPRDIQRVFVGRVEMLSPETEEEIASAISAKDRTTLAKYGRFLQPFAEQIRQKRNWPAADTAEFIHFDSSGCAQ